MPFERRLGQLIAVVGLLFICAVTLYPEGGSGAGFSFWCLVCGRRGGVDVILNVILFIPFALGLRLAGVPWTRAVGCAALVSVAVELLQVRLVPGRDSSLSDLITNTTGGLIGATLAERWRALLAPGPRTAGRLALGSGLFWLTILTASAWAFQPWVPRERLVGLAQPQPPDRPRFAGEVLSASLFGEPLGNGDLPDDRALRRRVVSGTLRLEAEVIPRRPYRRWAPIVALASEDDVVASIEQVGRDVAFKPPARTYDLRLRQPGLRLAGVVPEPGAPIHLAAEEREMVLRIEATNGRARHVRELALSPSFGWSLVLPFNYVYGPEVRWLTGLWIGGLLLPVGYWAGRAYGPRGAWRARSAWRRSGARWGGRWLFVLVSFAVLGLGVVPWLGGYQPVHWSEWLAGAAGAGTGWALARRATYLAGRCASPSISGSCSS